MSAPHLFQCLCHGYTFYGRIRGESQDIDDLQVKQDSFLTRMAYVERATFRQAGTGVFDLERLYESGDQRVSAGFPNAPYSPGVPGTPGVIPRPYLHPASSPPLSLLCGCGLCGGLEVPQRPYIPVQMSPDLSQRNGETLTFSKGGCGVLVTDAMKNRLSGLIGGDDLMFSDAPVSTFSLRIEVRDFCTLHVGSWVLILCVSGPGTDCGQERYFIVFVCYSKRIKLFPVQS